jgi:para-aminobenzoate synthetase/4-amino-4-deoxychorismate lyase
MKVVLRHAGRWLRFSEPVGVLAATSPDKVIPSLEAAASSGLYAAGFIAYEAAPAFDKALTTRDAKDFPLLCLGLFEAPETLEDIEKPAPGQFRIGQLQASVSKPQFIEAINKIKTELAEGATYQVNYTYRLEAPFSGDAWAFFHDLVAGQKAEHAAFVETPGFAICSASPELFFSFENGRLVSRPMKGTERRGRTQEEDLVQADKLQQSVKNRAENIMIVDMIRNDIGRVADAGTVEVVSRFDIEKYPTAWQMTSTVAGNTSRPLVDIFRALFPCASITGAPKAKTMEIIQSLETTPRKIYTGSVGFIAPSGEASFNVAIRTALIDKSGARLEFGVGGGIVWDSVAEEEFEETLTKARVLTQPRPAFELLETMLWEPGAGLFLLDEHLQRLRDSAAYFDIPLNEKQLRHELIETTGALESMPQRLRLTVNRYGKTQIESSPFTFEKTEPVQLAMASSPVDSQDILLFHKTTHRDVYEKARAECPGCDDVVLWNEIGMVTETSIANIVIRKGERLVTPPVTCGLLAGTFRAYLLARGEIEEDVFSIDDLKRAQEIFLINSLRRWRRAVLLPE